MLPLPADLAQRLDFLRDFDIRAERMQWAGQLTAEEALARKRELRAGWRRGLDAALEQGRVSAALRDQWLDALPE